MTERQAEYNLEWAHQQLLDHQEALSLERERFEDMLLEDSEEFSRWASRYVEANGMVNWELDPQSQKEGLQSFLDWCWTRHARTLKPGWTQAWEDRV
jgi:hypothetical protein